MRYQLPTGQTSISVAGQEFIADAEGVITVGIDAGEAVHTALQDVRLWGLKVMDEVEGDLSGAVTPSGMSATATASLRQHKPHMIGLLGSLGIGVDGRCTFAYLSKMVRTTLQDIEDVIEGRKAAPPAAPVAKSDASLPAEPVAAELAAAEPAEPPMPLPAADPQTVVVPAGQVENS